MCGKSFNSARSLSQKMEQKKLLRIDDSQAISQAKKHEETKRKENISYFEIHQKYDGDNRRNCIRKRSHKTIHRDNIDIFFADALEKIGIGHDLHHCRSDPRAKKQDDPHPKTFIIDERYEYRRNSHHDKACRKNFLFAKLPIGKLPCRRLDEDERRKHDRKDDTDGKPVKTDIFVQIDRHIDHHPCKKELEQKIRGKDRTYIFVITDLMDRSSQFQLRIFWIFKSFEIV